MLPSECKPWLKTLGIDASKYTYKSANKTIYSYLKEKSSSHLDRIAIDYYGYQLTYGELIGRIDEVADAYASAGIGKGDYVSFLTVSFIETVCSVYALSKLGAACNFIDPRMDVLRIRNVIKVANSKMLIVLDKVFPKVRDTIKELNIPMTVIQDPSDSLPLAKKIAYRIKNGRKNVPYSQSVITWEKFFFNRKKGFAQEVPYEDNRTVIITQTGGTTGVPKGVELTNDALNSLADDIHANNEYEPGEIYLDIMPIFTSYGVECGTHIPLCIGSKLILVPDFRPDRFPELICKHKPTFVVAVPAFYEKLIHDDRTKNMDYSFVDYWVSGGDTANLAMETKLNDFLRKHGSKYPIIQGYGMSELSSVASFGFNHRTKSMSSGLPAPSVTISIFEPGTDRELEIGQEGEICISGPTIMKGYFRNPEETKKTMVNHSDGSVWVHSGDVGYMDEEGFVFIKGRIKRMITRFDGHKIFPGQIESFVSGYPGVSNCAVIATTDLDHGAGKYPLCVVEMANADFDKAKARDEITKMCNEQLEERGRPCAVIVIDKIPLTSFGKNDVLSLENEYGNYNYIEN